MQLLTFQSSYHRNLITNLSYTDLLLALLQVSTRVCVLSDSLVFRTACDDYYLEKQSCRRPQRAAELVAVHHVLPPPVGGAHLYIELPAEIAWSQRDGRDHKLLINDQVFVV